MEESAGQLVLGSACPVLAAVNVVLEAIFFLHRIEGKSTADARGLSSHETEIEKVNKEMSLALLLDICIYQENVLVDRMGSDNNPRGRPQKVHLASFKMLIDDFYHLPPPRCCADAEYIPVDFMLWASLSCLVCLTCLELHFRVHAGAVSKCVHNSLAYLESCEGDQKQREGPDCPRFYLMTLPVPHQCRSE
ncbi:hypothetical protein J6590_035141 [Homalodisca vitripennis]|nr:hypothetical protein J6590_035141 [Homalodisca vitripennis]